MDANPAPLGFRTIDGSHNNLDNPEWGAADTPLRRLMPADYADGISAPAGEDRLSAREISNIGCAQKEPTESIAGATDYVWQWGQFLDHDISLSDTAGREDAMDIAVPTGDAFFDPASSGDAVIEFTRSLHMPDTGVAGAPREQFNAITHWVDASQVYGSDIERALALRELDGSGRLRTSEGDLLPFNTEGFPNAMGSDNPNLFFAGDVRASENVGLAAMHTLFVREHNRLVEEIAQAEPELDGGMLYERARQIVGALMQQITYAEYLPAILGPDPLDQYAGYDPSVDPRIMNVFSTALYRWGHSSIGTRLMRTDANGDEIAEGHLALRDAFFSPQRLVETGVAPVLRGLSAQMHQRIDPLVVDDLRNFLFGPPGSGGLDLASLNIQRGRDHGLPSYNHAREAFGLTRRQFLTQLTTDPTGRENLLLAYDDVDNVDVWVGALAEDPVRGGQMGELLYVGMKAQFEALRDGDRFWFENSMSETLVDEIRATTLADVIRRNSDVGDELPDNVFLLSDN